MLDRGGGTCSHSGMMDFPRILFTEGNPGKFLECMKFQSSLPFFLSSSCPTRGSFSLERVLLRRQTLKTGLTGLVFDISADFHT